MIRTKLGLLGLCAVAVGTMAMSVSPAQGATLSWLILNSAGTTATELLANLVGERDSPHLILLTKIVKLMISVTCNNFELVSTNITGVGQIEAGGQAKFSGCAVYKTSPLTEKICDVKTAGQPLGTIVSNKGKGKLALHTFSDQVGEILIPLWEEVVIAVTPEVGTTFATLLFPECSLPEENPVSGSLFLKDFSSLTTHSLSHLVSQNSLTSLTVGSDTAEHLETSLIGSGLIRLGGSHVGLKWSAMDA